LSGLRGLTHLEVVGWSNGASERLVGEGQARLLGETQGLRGDRVLSWLATQTALQHLRLGGSQLIPAGGLGELRGLSALAHLVLEDLDEGDTGGDEEEELGLANLEGCCPIRTLELRGCRNPSTVAALRSLAGSLTSLDVSSSRAVTDATMRDGVGGLTRLVGIDISGCWGVTDEGLLEALRPLPRLQTLRTDGCHRISPIPALMLGLRGNSNSM
jgi:hypothetical protein